MKKRIARKVLFGSRFRNHRDSTIWRAMLRMNLTPESRRFRSRQLAELSSRIEEIMGGLDDVIAMLTDKAI